MAARSRSARGAGLSPGAAHYYARIYSSARAGCLAALRRAGCTEEEAEDIFGTTLERIMGKFDPTDSPYSEAQMVALLKKACGQKLIDERRHRGVLRMVPLEEAAARADESLLGPAEAVERREAMATSREAIGSLPERDRLLFLQRHELHLSPEEILRRNPGLSRRTYRKIIQRANARALAAFEEIDSGERCEWVRSEYMHRYVAGEARERELAVVRSHLRSCRSCRVRAERMRDHLHDVAAGLAVTLAAGHVEQDHLVDWLTRAFGEVVDRAHALGEVSGHARARLRDLALRFAVGTPGSGADTATGQLAGISMAKAVPVCAGALAAGCLAASGVIPSLDVLEPTAHRPASRETTASPAVRYIRPPVESHNAGASPAPSPTGNESDGQTHPARPEPRAHATVHPRVARKPSSEASSPTSQSAGEFGGEAAGAGRPFTPLPSAPPVETESAGTEVGEATRSRSAGANSGSASGSSEFGM